MENTVTPKTKEEAVRLMTARNQQSQTLVATAKELLRQSTEIDLANLCTEILYRYPEAHFLQLLKDQRTGYENVIFCGHLDDENGNKIANSFEAKEYVEKSVTEYNFAAPDAVLGRLVNMREYAAKAPEWYTER